jgi:signal transduction histidine kinase
MVEAAFWLAIYHHLINHEPDMNLVVRIRLVLLVAAIAGLAGMTLWAVRSAGQRINELEGKLTAAHLESFRLADHFQQDVLRLNNSILRFVARREPGTWTEFEHASRQVDAWIDDETPKMSSMHARQLMQELNSAYDDYLATARRLYSNQQQALVDAAAYAQLAGFEKQGDRLLQLGIQLADAHRESQESFLGDSNRTLAYLQAVLFGGVGLLLLLGMALAFLIYRDLIAPLRVKLVESRALLERHEKLASLGMLAAGIAHEIRNPLTAIKARLYTLDKRIKGNQPALSDTAIISSEINRLERIVQEVLQFARPAEPKFVAAPADAPLREVQALLAAPLEKQGVKLVCEPGPDLRVRMDPALIKQVLVNLVNNAAEAIEAGGTVTLRARADHLKLGGRLSDVAVLEVIDTGKGIPPDVEARLFDPFFSTKEGGTGLGLAIAARVVEKHAGALEYQTQVGHGTTFGIILPRGTDGRAPGAAAWR